MADGMGVNDVLHLAVYRGDHMPRIDKRIRLFGLTTGRISVSSNGGKGKRKSWAGLFSPWSNGSKAMGQTASLLTKAVPSLPHHGSIGSLSLPMTIFLEL